MYVMCTHTYISTLKEWWFLFCCSVCHGHFICSRSPLNILNYDVIICYPSAFKSMECSSYFSFSLLILMTAVMLLFKMKLACTLQMLMKIDYIHHIVLFSFKFNVTYWEPITFGSVNVLLSIPTLFEKLGLF